MTLTPLVSVVIPTYNRSLEIARCLSSLVSQTFREFEVLVCDDGSTDNTQEVVNTFAGSLNIKYFWLTNFGGPARPRNVGIQNANGKYIAFLDSDDWWTPEKLEKSVEALESGADLVYHDLHLSKNTKDNLKIRISRRIHCRKLLSPVFDDLLFNGNPICCSSVVVNKDIIKKVGGFSEDKNLIAAEDYDAWLRLARHTEAFLKLKDCLGYYSLGEDNLSSADRTITCLARLLELYNNKLKLGDRLPPLHISYSFARSYYKTGERQSCISYCLAAIRARSFLRGSLFVKFKSVLLLLMSLFLTDSSNSLTASKRVSDSDITAISDQISQKDAEPLKPS